MQVSNVSNMPIPSFDGDRSQAEVRGQDRPTGHLANSEPQSTDSGLTEPSLMSSETPEGADPKLWEMLGPAERAYLSGGFDGLSNARGGNGSTLGRGVHVDLHV